MKHNNIVGYFDDAGDITEFENCSYAGIELLGRGENLFMLISKNSLPLVLEFSWYLGADDYPVTYGSFDGTVKCGRGMKIHHLVIKSSQQIEKGLIIDHINRNRLDNRLENLRICSAQENSFNRTKNSNSKHNMKGVKQISKNNWSAVITKNGVKHEIKNLPTEEEAGKMYDIMAEDLFGVFASKNFE